MRVLQLYTSTRSFFEDQLRALDAAGVECTAVGVPGSYDPTSPRTPADYLRYLPRVLDYGLDDYDVVHANYGLTAPFALVQPTRPVVFTPWGSDLMSDRRWLTGLSRLSARAADAVVAPSRPLAEALPCDSHHVPFGVDRERFRPVDRAEARERLGWDPEARVLLFPYDPERPEKDYPRARRAVEAADADAELRVVTDAPHEEVPLYMNASDAVLVTSRREAGPMVVKEATACNVPVVATDVGFVAEVLDGVTNAHVCATDEELVAAVESVLDGRRRADGRGSITGLDEMGAALREVYRGALGGDDGA